MRIRRVVPAAALLAIAVAAPTAAQPVVRYTWGPADGLIVNQDFTSPATYVQTLSVTGLSGVVSRISLGLQYGPYWGPHTAWHAIQPPENVMVSPPLPDCEGAPGFSLTTVVAGATAIANAAPAAQITCAAAGITNPTIVCRLQLELAIDPPLVADPAVRYGIVTLEFHHQNSVAGYDPDACYYAGLHECFLQLPWWSSATVNGVPVSLDSEGGLLSWENASGRVDCWRAATPARASSWGSIKTLYR